MSKTVHLSYTNLKGYQPYFTNLSDPAVADIVEASAPRLGQTTCRLSASPDVPGALAEVQLICITDRELSDEVREAILVEAVQWAASQDLLVQRG